MRPDDLHVIILTRAVASLHGTGGLERHVHDLLRHLMKRGVRVTLVTRPSPSGSTLDPDLFDPARLTVRLVPYRTFPGAGHKGTTAIDRSTAYPWFGWRAGRLAAALVRQGGIHVVHGMGAASLGYARARAADWVGTVPFVFNPHGMEEFGSTGPGLDPLKWAAYAPLRAAVRTCARAADRIIATDRAMVPTVLKHLRVPAERVSVVPNAIDLDEVKRLSNPYLSRDVREGLRIGSRDVLLVGVGRLEENKGFQHLIAALSLLSRQASGRAVLGDNWRCVVLGEGSYRPILERDIESADLARRVILPGYVSDAEVHTWYEAATLFVHPTLYEGSSLVALEAMAHRKAIVATSAGGLPDKVTPGINGWLVQPGDPNALGEAIEDALAHRNELPWMGLEGRARVEREFAWDSVVERLLDLYDALLAGGPSRSAAAP